MDPTPAPAEPLLVAQQLAKAYRHRRVVDSVSMPLCWNPFTLMTTRPDCAAAGAAAGQA